MGKIGFMLLGGAITIVGLGVLILICMLASWISDKMIMHKINKKNNLNRQLAEATEIIKDYYELRNGIFTNEDDFNMAQESLDKKAEQFLKDKEVEK